MTLRVDESDVDDIFDSEFRPAVRRRMPLSQDPHGDTCDNLRHVNPTEVEQEGLAADGGM